MKIQYVRQKDDFGCAVACISMVTGIPYDKVAQDFHADFKREGIHPEKTRDYVLEHGFSGIEVIPARYNNVPLTNARISKPFAEVHILSVQPRADSDLNHAIVMDKRGRVYDHDPPQHKNLSHYYCIVRVLGLFDERKKTRR